MLLLLVAPVEPLKIQRVWLVKIVLAEIDVDKQLRLALLDGNKKKAQRSPKMLKG